MQANGNAFSISQLISWNANLNRDCSNIEQQVGMQICISFPGEPGSLSVSGPATTIAPAPPNMATGTNRNCSRFYNVSTGDYCSFITVQQGISLDDFYFLNPEINTPDCDNLLLGESYCVAPVGSISTYPGYGYVDFFFFQSLSDRRLRGTSVTGAQDACKGLSAVSSCFATTYMTGADWAWPTQAASPTVTAGAGPLPLAPGTLGNCTAYDQYYASTSENNTTYNINSCYAVARFHGATTDQLVAWNPSLIFDSNKPESCVLVSGLRYCVSTTEVNNTTAETTPMTTAPTSTVVAPTTTFPPALTGTCSGGVSPPAPTQSGEPCWCQKWVPQVDDQYCADMATAAGITLAQLYQLNPALNNDCSGLFKGYSYCVAPVLTDPACAGGTSPPEQVQEGISCKCNSWVEQQSGKYCADMAAAAGISLQQLYNLNPALKGDCSGLFTGYAYCVGLAS